MTPPLNISIPLQGSRPWKGIVIHHSASPDGVTRDWDAIRRYHTSYRIDGDIVSQTVFEERMKKKAGHNFEKPWLDIGYHFGTELVNGNPVFNWGRPLSMVGAHAGVAGFPNTYNTDFLGFCCIGNYDLHPPDPKLWEFSKSIIRAFIDAFHMDLTNVIGHRDFMTASGFPDKRPALAANSI